MAIEKEIKNVIIDTDRLTCQLVVKTVTKDENEKITDTKVEVINDLSQRNVDAIIEFIKTQL